MLKLIVNLVQACSYAPTTTSVARCLSIYYRKVPLTALKIHPACHTDLFQAFMYTVNSEHQNSFPPLRREVMHTTTLQLPCRGGGFQYIGHTFIEISKAFCFCYCRRFKTVEYHIIWLHRSTLGLLAHAFLAHSKFMELHLLSTCTCTCQSTRCTL